MKKEEFAVHLRRYLPDDTIADVVDFIWEHKVQLKVSPSRKTILGNYRPPVNGGKHRISINSDLNPFAFLVTLTHEMAHLLAWKKYQNRILPHGGEWKALYAQLLSVWLEKDIFPPDLALAVVEHVTAPGASTCSDPELHRALKKYNAVQRPFLEELEEGQWFRIKQGGLMQRGKKKRSRFECLDYTSGKRYLVPAIMEVEPVAAPVAWSTTENNAKDASEKMAAKDGDDDWQPIAQLPIGSRCRTPDGQWLEICQYTEHRVLCGDVETFKLYRIVGQFKVIPMDKIPKEERPEVPAHPLFTHLLLLKDGQCFQLNGEIYKKIKNQKNKVLALCLDNDSEYLIDKDAWVRLWKME